MDDTTATDVILAAGPTAVALAALAFAAWQQWRGFRHEREMADLTDARTLFDEAVVALRHADDARHRATQALYTHGDWAGERAPEASATVQKAADTLVPLHERMAVRLGLDHDAVTGFNKVILTLREVAHLIAMPSDHADFRGALAATKKAEQEFQAARDAFMKFAVRTVGSKLP